MSETAILWLFGVIITLNTTVQSAIVVAIWTHMKDCRDFRASSAAIAADLKRVMHDIGDHERGIRGDLHRLREQVSPFLVWAQRQIEREGR